MVRALHVGDDGWPLMGEVVGRGELIIMLHGGGPDHYSMRPLADRLAGRYRVALPDIRGYGASRCPDPTLHRWDQYVSDVIAIVHALDDTCAPDWAAPSFCGRASSTPVSPGRRWSSVLKR